MAKPILHCADVMEWASNYEEPLYHALLADSPYEYGFMSKSWDAQGVSFKPETWAAFKRILHPGAFGMTFGGARTWHRIATAIEDAGFIIHPSIFLWTYGQGFPKATRVQQDGEDVPDFRGHRYGLQCIKPAAEPVIIFQRPYAGRPVDSMVATGAGALNIDGARVGTNGESMHGSTRGKMQGAVGSNFGFTANNDPIDYHPSGRWPSNLVLSHSSLPVAHLRYNTPREVAYVIAEYFNGYCAVQTVRERLRGAGKSRSIGAQQVLQQPVQERLSENTNGREKPTLREAAYREHKGADSTGTAPQGTESNRAEASGLERRGVSQQRVSACTCRTVEQIGSSVGGADDVEGTVCTGTPPCNGAHDRPSIDEGRTCASQERQEVGQSAGKLGTNSTQSALETASGNDTRDSTVEVRERTLEVFAGDIPDGWRHYFELTGEDLGCERIGTRRVRTGTAHGGNADKSMFGIGGLWNTAGQADADGLETVDAWRCAPGCPVDALGRQSGERHSYGPFAPSDSRGTGSSVTYGVDRPQGQVYADEGTAARYFFQSDYAAERLEAADPLFYCAKASTAEREAGLSGRQRRNVTYNERPSGGLNEHLHDRAIPKRANIHPTCKPIALARHLATLLLPPARYAPRRLFVPFAGVCSEMLGAAFAGWEHIDGVELEQEHCEIGQARLDWWLAMMRQTHSTDLDAILKTYGRLDKAKPSSPDRWPAGSLFENLEEE